MRSVRAHAIARLLPACLLAIAALAVQATPVAAHAVLLASDPAANATLRLAPSRVTLTFNEPLDPASLAASLERDGEPVDEVGLPRLAEGTIVEVDLPPLGDGLYTLVYGVTSTVDGHVTSGSFTFLIDPAGGASVGSPVGPVGPLVRGATQLCLLLAVGMLLLWYAGIRGGVAGGPPVPWRWIGGLAVLAGVGAGVDLAGSGVTLGRAVTMGAAILVAGLALAPRARWLGASVATAAIALVAGSLDGHATGQGGWAGLLLDAAHRLGAAAWVGGLAGLVVAWGGSGRALAARGLARVAVVAAPVLAVSGIGSAAVLLGEGRDLVATGYGNLLLAKSIAAAVAVAIGMAALALPRIAPRRLGAIVGVEATIAIAAMVASVGLAASQPAAARTPQISSTTVTTAHLYARTDALTLHLSVDLPTPGEQRVQAAVTDPIDGSPDRSVTAIRLRFEPPSGSDAPPTEAAFEPGAGDIWLASGTFTPVVGNWTLRGEVERREAAPVEVTLTMPVVQPLPPRLLPPPSTGIVAPAPLAVAWRLLPGGLAAWLLPLLLAGTVVLLPASRHLLRATVTAVAVVAILVVGSRDLVAAANRPPEPARLAINPVRADDASVERGAALYAAACAACHGPSGAGDGPIDVAAAPLGPIVRETTDGTLAWTIANGVAGTEMPAFALELDEQDRWDLVNYLRATFDGQ